MAHQTPEFCCSPVSKRDTHQSIFFQMQVAKLKLKPAFEEEWICRKDAEEPPYGKFGKAGTGAALGASGLNRSGFSSLLVCFSVTSALFLQSVFLRRQEPGPPASSSWLTSSYFVMREKRALIFLVSSCKIPEDDSGWAWITCPTFCHSLWK